MTQDDYQKLRNYAIYMNIKQFFPSYHKLLECKKQCYPPTFEINETRAKVEPFDCLIYTIKRFIIAHLDVDSMINTNQIFEINFVSKIGFDGSQSKSIYSYCSQDFSTDQFFSLCTFLPLSFELGGNSVWQNDSASSNKFLRPLFFAFEKESDELTCDIINEAINSMSSYKKKVEIEFDSEKIEIILNVI